MRMTIGKKLTSGFGILLLLLVIFGIVVLINVNSMIRQFDFVVTHDAPVIANARQLAKLVVDMETGQRGFCITMKDEFLEPYNKGNNEFERLIAEEKKLVSDNPSQVNALEMIEGLVKEWHEKAAIPEIAMARKVAAHVIDVDYLQEILLKGVGKGIMDEMRGVMDEMIKSFKIDGNTNGLFLTQSVAKAMLDQETGQRGFLISGNEEFLEPFKSGQKLFKDSINELRKLNSNAYDISIMKRNIDQLEKLANDWHQKAGGPEIAAREKMNKHPETIKDVAAMLEAGTGKNILDQIRKEFDKFIEVETKLTAKRYASASGTASGTIRIIIILVIFSLIFGIIVSTFIARGITNPLNVVGKRINEIAGSEGDLTATIPVTTRDELGDLAGSFNKMLGGLKTMVAQFKEVAERMSSSSQQLSSSAQEMNATTEEVSSTVQQIATGSSKQAEATETTSKIIEDISTTIKENVSAAQMAATASMEAIQKAQSGRNAAQKAVEKMGQIDSVINESVDSIRGLKDRSRQIGRIVEVITGFANQTNLLSLNAAIEAARAGESGRGFAVVAEEVRKLAEGSKKSSEEIADLIAEIQAETDKTVVSIDSGSKEVTDGMEVVKEASIAFEEITKGVEEAGAMSRQVASSSQQIAKGNEKIVKAMEEISATAEENASGVQEVSASAEEQAASMEEMASSAQELSDMAVKLAELTAKFKVEGDEDVRR